MGEAVQILSSESLNTGGALAGKRRASVCGASDAYGGSGDASIDVKMFRMRVLKGS